MRVIDQNIIDRDHCGMRMLENGYQQADEPPPHDAPPVRLWTSFKPYCMPVMRAEGEATGIREGKEGWPKYCWCKYIGIDPDDGSGLLEPVPGGPLCAMKVMTYEHNPAPAPPTPMTAMKHVPRVVLPRKFPPRPVDLIEAVMIPKSKAKAKSSPSSSSKPSVMPHDVMQPRPKSRPVRDIAEKKPLRKRQMKNAYLDFGKSRRK